MQSNNSIDPEDIRKHYSHSLADEKCILFTGHSHRAWPNVALIGQTKAIDLAFKHKDKKWSFVFEEIIPQFQKAVAKRIGVNDYKLIAHDENSHNLLVKVLSCFPWNERTKIVTSDSEFHSASRQFKRLEEEGVKVTCVNTSEKETFTDSFIEAIDKSTTLIYLSTVFFTDGYVVQDLEKILDKARKVKATIILDIYHQFGIRKINIDGLGKDIFVLAGGYKYAQAGEGAAWMKIPENCKLRPAFTGWFSDYESLEKTKSKINYHDDASRFYGATRDLSGIYRAISVFEWMDEIGLDIEIIEKNNLAQTKYLIDLYDELELKKKGLELLSSRKDSERGPFLALKYKNAKSLKEKLEKKDICADARGNILRIGPAEYTKQEELELVMREIKELT